MQVLNIARMVLMLVALAAGPTEGQDQKDAVQEKHFGDYSVHYNVVAATFLPEEITERYDIERDEDNFVVTISVRGPNAEGEMTDQPSEVSGFARDLVTAHELEFREYQDPQAVYYLAEVPAPGRTELDFTIDVAPEDSDKTFQLEFSEFISRRRGEVR